MKAMNMIRIAIQARALVTIVGACLWLAVTVDCPAQPAGAQKLSLNLKMGPDGKLTREQFMAQNPTEDPNLRQMLSQIFDRFDPEHTGVITMEQLARILPQAQGQGPPPPPAGPDDEPEAEPAWPSPPDPASVAAQPAPYAVVISETANSIPEWKAVADALVAKHKGVKIVHAGSIYNSLPDLIHLQPRYTAFVARPEILGRVFVARVHRLTRQLDDDPYTDTIWGIVSGDTPQTALRIATADQPKIVRSVISLTGVTNPLYDEVYTISDGKPGDWYRRHKDGKEETGSDGDVDRARDFVKQFTEMKPDALVGSGHATERNLEIPFGKGNTEVRDGKWVAVENWRRKGAEEHVIPIPEDGHPRIYLGAGNCLIGNFQKRKDSLAAVMMGRHGVNQMVGYTMVTWYGKGGWGTLGAWQGLCGTHSLAEAFYFNNQVITHELKTRFPATLGKTIPIPERGHGTDVLDRMNLTDKDEAGMLWDRDVVAFYGDPAFRITLDPAKDKARTKFSLKEEGGRYRFEASAEAETKGLVAMNFPKRIRGEIEVTAGGDLHPVVTDDFILIPEATLKPGKPLRVEFTVKSVK
jgi:zinc protease